MSRRLFWPITASLLIVLGLLLDRLIPAWPWNEVTLPGTHTLMRVDSDGQRFHTAAVEQPDAFHFPSLPWQVWNSNDGSLVFRLDDKNANDLDVGKFKVLGDTLLALASDGLNIIDLNTLREHVIPAADPASRFQCYPKQRNFPWVYGSLPDGEGWNLAWLNLQTGELRRCPGRQVGLMASQTRCYFTADKVIVAEHSGDKHVDSVEVWDLQKPKLLERREQHFKILSDSPDFGKSLIQHLTGEPGIYHWLDGTNQPVDADVAGSHCLWSPDSVLLAVFHDEGEKSFVIWNTLDAKASKRAPLPNVQSGHFSSDGARLFVIQCPNPSFWDLSCCNVATGNVNWRTRIPAGWDNKLVTLEPDRLVICDPYDYLAEIQMTTGTLRFLWEPGERLPKVSNPSISWGSQVKRPGSRVSPNGRFALQVPHVGNGSGWAWFLLELQKFLNISIDQHTAIVDTTNGRSVLTFPSDQDDLQFQFSQNGLRFVLASLDAGGNTRFQTWDLTRTRERWLSVLVPLGLAIVIALWRRSRLRRAATVN